MNGAIFSSISILCCLNKLLFLEASLQLNIHYIYSFTHRIQWLPYFFFRNDKLLLIPITALMITCLNISLKLNFCCQCDGIGQENYINNLGDKTTALSCIIYCLTIVTRFMLVHRLHNLLPDDRDKVHVSAPVDCIVLISIHGSPVNLLGFLVFCV